MSTSASAAPPRKTRDEILAGLAKPIVVKRPGLKVTVNEVRFVASWKWDIPDEDVCGICHGEYERCCPSCKIAGDDCPPIWGACNHAFHMHCLMKWLEAPKANGAADAVPECPMCRRPWEFRSESNDAGAAAASAGGGGAAEEEEDADADAGAGADVGAGTATGPSASSLSAAGSLGGRVVTP